MQAIATGTVVIASGTGACMIDGIEDLKFLQINYSYESFKKTIKCRVLMGYDVF